MARELIEGAGKVRDALSSENILATLADRVKLTPVLRENLVETSRLLSTFSAEPGKSFEEFKAAYEELQETLRARLRKVLNGDQLKALAALQDELLERIRNASFAKG